MFFFLSMVATIADTMLSALLDSVGKKHKGRKGSSGSYGAWTWSNIMNAHCAPEDLVDEFGMAEPDSYEDPKLGMCPYERALEDAYERLGPMAMMLGIDVDELVEECEEEIEEEAYDYAVDYADRLFTGKLYIPDDAMLDWGYYDISGHNI